jgi:prepilin-type N-terminal cleavage/methylation domain-containing protein
MIPRPLQPEPVGGRARSSRARGRGEGAVPRRGFTLVELLVVVSIILVLMSMLAAGMIGARGSQKKQATQLLIARIDRVIQQQYVSCASRTVSSATSSANRAEQLRRLVSAEMPDNWKDVALMASGSANVPLTSPQRAYIGYRSALNPSDSFSDAECLFMIVMVGGVADCLDCGDLANAQIGDKDGDRASEFLDEWGQPIRYVLWPAGFELPPGSGRFFSATAPFSAGAPAAAKGGTMRPLIFSGGPDQTNAILVNGDGNLGAGMACGDPANSTVATFGGLDTGGSDARRDNITNFDTEVGK